MESLLNNNSDNIFKIGSVIFSSISIIIFLIHIYEIYPMTVSGPFVLIPSLIGLAILILIALKKHKHFFLNRLIIGICGGLFATIIYDVVRIPLVLAGSGLFKAMPVFGEFLTGMSASTPESIIIGWLYHFSNGISFGVIYAMIIGKRYWFYAVIWGILLETAMLFSPYPVVIGTGVAAEFIYYSFGAHLCYGIALGLFLRRFGAYSIQEIQSDIKKLREKKIKGIIEKNRFKSLLKCFVFQDNSKQIWIPNIDKDLWYVLKHDKKIVSDPPSLLWRSKSHGEVKL